MRFLALFFLMSLSLNVSAAPVTIDLEEQPVISTSNAVGEFESKGFTFRGVGGGSALVVNNGSFCTESTRCGAVNPGGTFEISATSGQSFNLYSIDLSDVGSWPAAGLDVVGNFADGGSISTTLQRQSNSWDTYSLQWYDLSSIQIGAASEQLFGLGFDNVVVSSVPVPAAVWLFVSALTGLGWMRRRTTGASH